MNAFVVIVAASVVAAVVYAALTVVCRRGLAFWHRRKPFTIRVKHLPHAPPEFSGQKVDDNVAVEVGRIVREPWAVSLAGRLPDSKSFEGTNPLPSQAHAWLLSHGGVDYRETKLRLSLTSNTDERIVIRDIRVEAQRREPLAGTYVYCPTAGAAKATLLIFELDEQEPQAREWAEDGVRRKVGATPYFAHHRISVKKDETCDFVIIGRATTCFARWRLVVHYEVGRHARTLIVADGDDWFLTSGDPPTGFAARLHWAWYAGNRFLPEPQS